MNKAMLKWVLAQQEEAVLYDLAIATNCKVKGFREITRNNIKQIRPQVMNELQKTTKVMRLKAGLRKHINQCLTEEAVKDIRKLNRDELLELVNTGKYSLINILLALTTGEVEDSEEAEALFAFISDSGNLARYEPQTGIVQNQGEEPASIETAVPAMESIIRDLEERLSQEKLKAVKLDEVMKELREKRKAEVQEWKKERKTHTEEIKALKIELENKEKQITEQADDIAGLKEEVSNLQEEVKRLITELKTKTVDAANLISPQDQQIANLTPSPKKVVLLGEGVHESFLHTPQYDVELVGNGQIEDFLQRESHSEEIWMLSFQISPPKQRKLKSVLKEKTIKEFLTLVELQSYLNKR